MAKNLSLIDRIRYLIRQEIEAALHAEGEITDADALLRSHDLADSVDDLDRSLDVAPRTRRRRVVGEQVQYHATKKPTKADIEALFPTAEKCYRYIYSRKRGVTARQVQKATRLGKKTVESALYQLRHAGLIESRPIQPTT